MEIVNVEYLGFAENDYEYRSEDLALITPASVSNSFGGPQDYIEYFIQDLNGNISAVNYNVTSYKFGTDQNPVTNTANTLVLDPEGDLRRNGFNRGTNTIKYNFFRKLLNSGPGQTFWIKEISPSRTEIKVARQDLSNTELGNAFGTFNAVITSNNYYPDFLLNFGADIQLIAVNALYVVQDDVGYVLIKLYEPLPFEYDVKSQFWVVQKIADSVEYQVGIEIEQEDEIDVEYLRGPNYKVKISEKQGQTTPYYNYNTLLTTSLTSSYQQLQSWLEDKAISINVDYSDFSNFIHFSSATERLLNFQYKVQLIESYQADIAAGNLIQNTSNNIISNTSVALQDSINNIISKFDTYEYYLYYESASTAWPKQNNIAPYVLYSVTSSQVLDWIGNIDTPPTTGVMSMLYSASLYDINNKDNLEYTAPTYIRDDVNNQPYITFLNMIGQHFDNIWIYYKDVTNRYVANNNPQIGISMDVVADALRGFGMELYTNSNISDNIYFSLLGINETGSALAITSSQYAQIDLTDSSLYPLAGNDYLSASIYLPPFGQEKINRYVTTFQTPSTGVTASFPTIAPNQLDKEYYKRLYHNLPYLLKTRGTQRGVKALIACYGIPNTILTVNEFGGYDIYAQPGIQQIQNEKVFTGSLLTLSSSLISPFVTNQYYLNNTERGSIDVEVGFSPADSINAHITGTLGNFNIMQYMGDPSLQYSSSYTPLVTLGDNYFRTYYTQRYNVWDFIRLIKFYNNSLFKSIKDYVPARASVASGIIIKSHILERNKYARHEPIITRSEHSESIDLVRISGSDAPVITASTAYTGSVMYLSGAVAINNQYHFEPYTGEFGGSIIDPTTGYFPQIEQSSITAPWTSSVQGANLIYTTYSISYLYQNVSGAVLSTRFLDLDYSSNPYVPVNYGLITQSIDNYPASLNDPYAPWAELQDYNYYLRRSVLPRYSGSKSTSLYYNVFTGPSGSWPGDSSYGSNPSIDYNTYKLGWVRTIPTESLNFYEKTTINLKYLIDSDLNVTELSANNDNLVEVQNTFKSGTPVKVSVTDIQFPSNQVTLNGTKNIYRGGYRFDPIIYRENNETLAFTFEEPISSSLGYIGVKARSDDYYTYYATSTQRQVGNLLGIRAVPDGIANGDPYTGAAGGYEYTINGTPTTARMATRAIAGDTWPYLNSSNPKINIAPPPSWVIPTYDPRYPSTWDRGNYNIDTTQQTIYQFNLVNYGVVINNTEPSPSTFLTSGNYFYKVPRASTYTFEGQVPMYLKLDHSGNLRRGAGVIKLAAILEQSADPTDPSSWEAVTDTSNRVVATDLEVVTINGPNAVDNGYNALLFDNSYESVVNLKFQAASILLGNDTYLRVSLYLMDLSDSFGRYTDEHGFAGAYFTINVPDSIGASLFFGADKKAYIDIRDLNATYTDYYYTTTYDDINGAFFTTSSTSPDTLVLNESVDNYLLSASIFEPGNTLTAAKYTQIVDRFSIQKYDLLRLGRFENTAPDYYTVVDVSRSNRPPITLTGDFYTVFNPATGNTIVYFDYPYSSYAPGQFIAIGTYSDVVTITGATNPANNITVPIRSIGANPQYQIARIFFPDNTPMQAETGATVTFTIINNNPVNIKLDRNLTTTTPVTAANFALLRPKPDETSVIINYRKKPGLVSQTLLIPNNASKMLIDNTGTIFESLNTQLQ